MKEITIIGGGLAGSEAAYYLLKRGYAVTMYERRPSFDDKAHETGYLGELVCSNSLKSKRLDNACGLLKEEMRLLGSIMMEEAFHSEVPSGNALSVDRLAFAKGITDKLLSFPNFHLIREECFSLPTKGICILATGPLTSDSLLAELSNVIGAKNLSFFDASAPIVKKESIDFSKAYYKSRFEQGDDAYINCPMNREEYYRFVNELLLAKRAEIHEFDTRYFEGCMPLEAMASRGMETLRHGPLKPFGLEKEGERRPYAVAQLRQDNLLGDLYNIVGFQTNLTYGEQKRVFSLIPGLEKAEFVRYGLMHRNSYINSPFSLNEDLSLTKRDNLFVAGQLLGVEGYVESAASGIVSAINAARRMEGLPFLEVPKNSVLGALLNYVLNAKGAYFAPMNANWSLFGESKKEDREGMIIASLKAIKEYQATVSDKEET